MKIPFTLEAWLKDKSQKIETRNGRSVHYIGLDRAGWQVFEIFRANGTSEYRTYHDSYLYSGPEESTYDLFIITPEPELSKFEEAVGSEIFDPPFNEEQIKVIKEESVKLLAIARNEIVKSGYAIIEGKHYLEEGRKNYERGKEEALNDLPRWKKADRDLDAGTIDFAVFHKNDGGDHEDWLSVEVTNRLYKGEYYIELSDLEKLPKED